MRATFFVALLSVLFPALSGCCTCRHREDEERVAELGAALIHLSSAVEGAVRAGDIPEAASEREILDAATKDDPGLLTPFREYMVRVQRQGRHAVVLVCDAGGSVGLLEDAGCSMSLDWSLRASNPLAPCQFGLDAATVCGRPGGSPPQR